MSPGRALIVVENLSVPFDRRVWQECLALREAGYDVSVICPQGSSQDREPYAVINGVEIHRYPLTAATGGSSGYLREYPTALWRSWRLARRLGRFDVVHICNPPDLLFLVALPLKLRGARVIFDQHDLVPELYLSRFGGGKDLLYHGVVALERLTYRIADVVIATNGSYRRAALERGRKAPEQVFVVRSAPDLSRFAGGVPDPALKKGKKHLLCYLGVMGPQDGVDYALRSLAGAAGHAARRLACRVRGRRRLLRRDARAGKPAGTGRPRDLHRADSRRGAPQLPLDGRRRAVAGSAQPAERRLDDEQGAGVHGRRPSDRLLRPARGSRLGRRCGPIRASATTPTRSRRRHPPCSTIPPSGGAWAPIGQERVAGALSWERSKGQLLASYAAAMGRAPEPLAKETELAAPPEHVPVRA